MCKIFIATNTAKMTKKQLTALIDAVAKPITDAERDGFGLAYNTESGLYAEQWVNPNDFLAKKIKRGPNDAVLMAPPEHNVIGTNDSKHVGGLLVHGRTSTNNVSLINTHPFVNDRYALIHNGVVQNIGEHVERVSTNDTEFVLTHYTNGGMPKVAESLTGYYACGLIDKTNGNTIVFRDATARLNVTWLDKFQCYIFATNQKIIVAACKALGVKRYNVSEAQENFHAVFDVNGDLISRDSFEPKKRSFGALDYKSLGSASSYANSYESVWADDMPSYRRKDESSIEYVNRDGMPISEEQFELLDWNEQAECQILQDGKLIA
jgi:predicted glutamine amidotransferase